MNDIEIPHGAQYIVRILENDKHQACVVGSYDDKAFDICTSASLIEVLNTLAKYGIEISESGLMKGVVIAHLNNEQYRIRNWTIFKER